MTTATKTVEIDIDKYVAMMEHMPGAGYLRAVLPDYLDPEVIYDENDMPTNKIRVRTLYEKSAFIVTVESDRSA